MRPRCRHRGRRRAGAFSLLEIVMVLALFGLIASLLIAGAGALLRRSDRDGAEQKALAAVAAARHQAVLAGRVLTLAFDRKTRRLDWGQGGVTLAEDEEVRLLPPARTGAMLVGGRVVEEPLARVRFHPDGTCDPFRLEIVQRGASQIIAIDPWTCAVLAPPAAAASAR